MKRFYTVEKDTLNTRLDRWIKRNVCQIPQSLIEKNIRKGNIKVNKKKEKSSYKLKVNDRIVLHNFDYKNSKNAKQSNVYLPNKKELSSTGKLFIDNNKNFAVINKPSGIAVQSGTKSRRNIIDILRKMKEFDNSNPYSVHRIDKETTGLLLVAKNRKYAQLLTSLFRIRRIHKTYLCIVLGEFKKDRGTLTDELFYYEGKKKIKLKAITHYKVVDKNNNYTLLQLNPQTGRKHQIRKQLLIHGHPVVGDSKYRITESYSDKPQNLMLHAYKINFSIGEVKYNFMADLPLVFKKALNEKYLKTF